MPWIDYYKMVNDEMCSFPKLSNRSSTYALFCLISLCASFFIFLQILWHFWSFDFLTCKKFVVRYDYELYLKIQRRNSLVLHKINRWVMSIICRTSSSELLVHVTLVNTRPCLPIFGAHVDTYQCVHLYLLCECTDEANVSFQYGRNYTVINCIIICILRNRLKHTQAHSEFEVQNTHMDI